MRSIEAVASSRKNTKETHRVEALFPESLRDRSAGLIQLLKSYYEFLNQPGQPSFAISNLQPDLDLDAAPADFLDHLQREVAVSVPRNTEVDRVRLYKNIRSYYAMRGSEESISQFFKIVLGDEAEIKFPRDQMLVPSSGKWDPLSSRTIYAKPPAVIISGNGSGAKGSAVVTGGSISAVNLISGGSGYTSAAVTIEGDGTGAQVLPILSSDGSISGFVVMAGGSGYTQPGTVIGTETGSYNSNFGFLSDVNKIQDSYFYQKFSYVIRTGSNVDVWRDAFQRLVHPAGFIFFGEILLLLTSTNALSRMPGLQPGLVSDEDVPVLIVLDSGMNMGGSGIGTFDKVIVLVPTGTSTSEMMKFYDGAWIDKYSGMAIQDAPAQYIWGDLTIADVSAPTPVFFNGIQLGVDYVLDTGAIVTSDGTPVVDDANNQIYYSQSLS